MNAVVAARPAGPCQQGGFGGYCSFLAVAATLATGQLFGFLGLLPAVSRDLGANARLGLPLFALGYATGMILLGALASALGAKRLIAASLAAGAGLSIVASMAPSLAVLVPLRFLEGVALGGFPPAAFVASAQRVPQSKILFASSAMAFGLLGSAGLAGLLSRGMQTEIGWRWALVVYGVLLFCCAFVATRQTGITPGRPARENPYTMVRLQLSVGRIVLCACAGAATMATFVTANGTVAKSSQAMVGLVLVIGLVLAVLSFAKVLVRRPPLLRSACGLVLSGAGAGLLAIHPGAAVIALAAVSTGATLTVPACIQVVTGAARGSVPAAVSVFTSSLFVGGAGAGLVVTGFVHVRFSTYLPVLGLALVACAAACVFTARGKGQS